MARGNVKSMWATMALRILPNLTSAGCQVETPMPQAFHIFRAAKDPFQQQMMIEQFCKKLMLATNLDVRSTCMRQG
jgi:hypothetical protein